MSRSLTGTIAFGYAGLPPWQTVPQLVEAFAAAHPDIRIELKELPFPAAPASAWLADVDVTLVSPLSADPDVWVQPVAWEQRAVVVSSASSLAGRGEVTVADVRDETFIRLEEDLTRSGPRSGPLTTTGAAPRGGAARAPPPVPRSGSR